MAAKQKFKPGINNVVSWGATIVIIGLLFKIQHWAGATWFITAGLGTEALLFALLGFQMEPVEPDWTKVYPELAEEAPAEPKAKKTNGLPVAVSLDKMITDANIQPDMLKHLGEGLKTFGEKVSTISKVADAGAATQEFTTKIKTASAGYDVLNTAFVKATASLADFASSNVDSKAYHEQVTNLAKNLSALNAVYELELQDSSVHLKSMNKFYQNLSGTMQNFNESLDDSKQFKEEVGKLTKNLASLNTVYGNMLSAMQPRA